MATYTPNLNLIKPAGTDYVRIGDFNDNVDKIDASVGDLGQLETSEKTNIVLAINEAAKSGGENAPYINEDTLTWMVWDVATAQYTDTGVSATSIYYGSPEDAPEGIDVVIDPNGSAFTTSNVPEGENLYYTPERADERVALHNTAPNAHSGQFANALIGTASGLSVQLPDVQPYTKVQGLTLFGQTTETGAGDKSPDNPYALSGTSPTKITVDGTDHALPALDAPMWSLPNGVRDSWDVLAGAGIRRMEKKVFNGTEGDWQIYPGAQSAGFTVFTMDWPDCALGFKTSFCSHLRNVNSIWGTDSLFEAYSDHKTVHVKYFKFANDTIGVADEDTAATKVNKLNAFLAATPITVVYELATPTAFATDPIAPPGLNAPVSTITADGAPFDVTYCRDINAAFAELQAAILVLGGS